MGIRCGNAFHRAYSEFRYKEGEGSEDGCVFFFNDTATTEIYTLSLHDALPIYSRTGLHRRRAKSSRREWEAKRGDRLAAPRSLARWPDPRYLPKAGSWARHADCRAGRGPDAQLPTGQ